MYDRKIVLYKVLHFIEIHILGPIPAFYDIPSQIYKNTQLVPNQPNYLHYCKKERSDRKSVLHKVVFLIKIHLTGLILALYDLQIKS